MFNKNSRENLRWALKATLLEQTSKIQVKEARMFVKNFILKEATYEQLLNLALNPYRDRVYLEAEKLEHIAKVVVQESLTGKSANSKTILESFIKETGGEELGLIAGAALAAVLIYRKMRKSGQSKQAAALAAANAERDPEKKQKWQALSQTA